MPTVERLSLWQIRERGACRDADPDLFHPEKDRRRKTKKAVAICRGCPVRVDCLEAALGVPESRDWGVFGGTTRQERSQLRKERNVATPPGSVENASTV